MARTLVTVDGVTHDVDDLTLDEIVRIEQVTSVPWHRFNPWVSAAQCRATLIAFYARTRTSADAERIVGALSATAAIGHLSQVDDDDDRPVEHRDGIPVVDPKAEPDGTGTT